MVQFPDLRWHGDSRQQLGDDLRPFFDACEAVIEAGVAIGELVVIKAE